MQETGWYYINNKRTLLQTFQSQQSFTWSTCYIENMYMDLYVCIVICLFSLYNITSLVIGTAAGQTLRVGETIHHRGVKSITVA